MTADKNGVAVVDIVDSLISLSGEYSIIGRTMVVSFHIIRICMKFLLTYDHVCCHDFTIVNPGF